MLGETRDAIGETIDQARELAPVLVCELPCEGTEDGAGAEAGDEEEPYKGLEFGVRGLGCWVWGLGCGVWGLPISPFVNL